MTKIKIFSASNENCEWAARLFARNDPWKSLGVTLEQIKKTCCSNDYMVYIAMLDDVPSGALVLHPFGVAGSPYLKYIAVENNFVGKGIGKTLIEFAEDLFRKDSKHFFLCVSSFNSHAQAFYKHLGYEAVGEFKDYIVDGKSEILLHKQLK